MDVAARTSVVPFLTMQDQPVAAGRIEAGSQGDHRLSAQQLFERERAQVARFPASSLSGLARALARLAGPTDRPASSPAQPEPRHLHGLAQHGAVTLHARRTSSGRRLVDHLVVAPSGIYVVEDRPWPGQVGPSGELLYVDGRLRSGVPESVQRTAQAVRQALGDELEPLGLGVSPVLCLPAAGEAWQPVTIQGVAVFTGRTFVRHVRQAEPLLGRDTVVRLALAADRLLEPAPTTQPS